MRQLRELLRRYGLAGTARLVLDLLHTRLMFRGARLVRRPAYVRGRRHIRLGARFTTGVGLRLDAFPPADQIVLRIGDDVQLNDYVHIAAIQEVTIGADTLVASKVFITDHHHGEFRDADPLSAPSVAPSERPLVARPVRIGRRVWIGEHVCILPGVTIGDGAVIGAGAIVAADVPPNAVAVGNPARVIRRYDDAASRWMSVGDTVRSGDRATAASSLTEQ